MEKDKSITNDEKLMAYWLARKADALAALDCADRQIAYLSNFLVHKTVVTENTLEAEEEAWIERGYN